MHSIKLILKPHPFRFQINIIVNFKFSNLINFLEKKNINIYMYKLILYQNIFHGENSMKLI